jgi:hydrogenase expression/formation protein HypC
MCLAIPSRVTEVSEAEAVVDHGGVKKRVRLDLLAEPVEVGDYLLIHTGFAIQRIPPGEAEETLKLFDELLRASLDLDDEGPPLSGSG